MLRIINFYRNYEHSKHSTINIICSATLVWSLAYLSFEYFVPLFLDEKGYNIALIGLLLSIPSMAAIFFDSIIGYLQFRVKRKLLFMVALTFLIAAAAAIYGGGGVALIVAFALILYGIGFDMFDITAYSSIFKHSDYNNSSTNISLRDTFEGLGLIIGGILAGFVFSESPMWLLLVFVFFMVISMAIIWSFYREQPPQHEHGRGGKISDSFKMAFADFKLIYKSKAMLVLILILTLTFWDGLFYGFEPIFAQRFTNPYMDETVFGGILLAIYILPFVALEYLFGKLEDKIGKRNFILIGFLFMSGGIFLIAKSTNIWLLSIAVFVCSTGVFAIAWPALSGYYEDITAKMIGRSKSGESVGVMEMFENFGYFLGPFAGGWLIHRFSFNTVFIFIAAIMLCLGIIGFLSLNKDSAKNQNQKSRPDPNN